MPGLARTCAFKVLQHVIDPGLEGKFFFYEPSLLIFERLRNLENQELAEF
jgi:hypothetical protein